MRARCQLFYIYDIIVSFDSFAQLHFIKLTNWMVDTLLWAGLSKCNNSIRKGRISVSFLKCTFSPREEGRADAIWSQHILYLAHLLLTWQPSSLDLSILDTVTVCLCRTFPCKSCFLISSEMCWKFYSPFWCEFLIRINYPCGKWTVGKLY